MNRVNTFTQALLLIGCCLSIAAFILVLYKQHKCNKTPVERDNYESTEPKCGNCTIGDNSPAGSSTSDNTVGMTPHDLLGLKIADVAYYGSKQYPMLEPPSTISGYSYLGVKNCWHTLKYGDDNDNNLFTVIYKNQNKYLIGVQGTESFSILLGYDSNLGVDFDILTDDPKHEGDTRLEKLTKCIALFIRTTITAEGNFDSADIIIGGHSLGGTIIMTIFMLAAKGNEDCMAVVSKIGRHQAILVNPFIGILPYMTKYLEQMILIAEGKDGKHPDKDKLRMIVHPGDPASAFWRLYTTTDDMCSAHQYDAGETLYHELKWLMGSRAPFSAGGTLMALHARLKDVFKLSTWNGGCNPLWLEAECDKPDKWCLHHHGVFAYGTSHLYGKSWMDIVKAIT